MSKQKKKTVLFPLASQTKLNEEPVQIKKSTFIKNPNIEQVKKQFRKKDLSLTTSMSSCQGSRNIQYAIQLIERTEISFLTDLSRKISLDDYQELISCLKLLNKTEGTTLIEKGRKPNHYLILIEGSLSYYIDSEASNEQVCVGTAEPGHLIYPEVFMTPKFVSFTIKCDTNCSFLTFGEEIFTKSIKKTLIREADLLVDFLNRTTLFDGLGTLNIRKYLAYFIPKTYKYNQVVYEAGSEAKSVQLIIEGEVELFSKQNRNNMGLVKLSQGECFGVDSIENFIRKYQARSTQSRVRVLCLDLRVLTMIRMEHPAVSENYDKFVHKIDKLHNFLLNRNLQLLKKNNQRPVIIKRKKKKGKMKKSMPDFQWWGLAENLKTEQKYRIPSPPNQSLSCTKKQRKDGIGTPRTLFTHKIVHLKKKALQRDLQNYEYSCEENEKEEDEAWITTNYVPKMTKKIQMLDPKPKAINMVQVVKTKLLTYARNMGTFCDRLNLE